MNLRQTYSAEARVAELMKDALVADEKELAYERRLLRVTVQEELHPLESLTSARDVVQVFVDVVQGKRIILFFSIAIPNLFYT